MRPVIILHDDPKCAMCDYAFQDDEIIRVVEKKFVCEDCYEDLPGPEAGSGNQSANAERAVSTVQERERHDSSSPCVASLQPQEKKDDKAFTRHDQPQLRAGEADPRDDQLAEIVAVLKAACDRDWTDETPIQVANVAANALHWRDQEIKHLQAFIARTPDVVETEPRPIWSQHGSSILDAEKRIIATAWPVADPEGTERAAMIVRALNLAERGEGLSK